MLGRRPPTRCTRIARTWPAPEARPRSGRGSARRSARLRRRVETGARRATGWAATLRRRNDARFSNRGSTRGTARRRPRAAAARRTLLDGGEHGRARRIVRAGAGAEVPRPIKTELETVLRLDPAFMDGSADRALGRWYFKVPSLFGGSNKQAEEHLRASLTYNPNSTVSHFFLAELLVDDGRKATRRARSCKRVIDAPLRSAMGAGRSDYKEQGGSAARNNWRRSVTSQCTSQRLTLNTCRSRARFSGPTGRPAPCA